MRIWRKENLCSLAWGMWIGIDTIENIMHISQKIKNGSAIVVVQSLSHVWLCDPMNCSTPGFPVCHYLPEFAQTHSHWVSDAMQPSHPLLPPSPLTLNLSQHQVLFNELTLHQLAKLLEVPSVSFSSVAQSCMTTTWLSNWKTTKTTTRAYVASCHLQTVTVLLLF